MQDKIFKVKIFEVTHKSVKSVKVFSLEIFRLYGTSYVLESWIMYKIFCMNETIKFATKLVSLLKYFESSSLLCNNYHNLYFCSITVTDTLTWPDPIFTQGCYRFQYKHPA